MEPKLKVKIDRSYWARSSKRKYVVDNNLLNDDGSMCCLGFVSLACGLKKKDISNIGLPYAVDQLPNKKYTEIWEAVCQECGEIAEVNDDYIGKSDAQREAKLTKMFKKIGIDVSFVGKTPKNPVWLLSDEDDED